jgi:uncharacterized lipoprotein YajG
LPALDPPYREGPAVFTRFAEFVATAGAIAFLAGCATPTGEANISGGVIIPVYAAAVVGRAAEAPRRAKVEMTDIRKKASMERSALGVSMGAIELRPAAPELVRIVVQTKADEVIARLGIADPQTVLCGIRVFDITTPSTPIYWDIDTKIEVVLRVRGRDGTVTASATDRTYVWPAEELISRVTTEALKSLAADTERVLTVIFAER